MHKFVKLSLLLINKKLRSRTYLVKTSFLEQLPFKFFNVHWDYVNCTARKVFRKITHCQKSGTRWRLRVRTKATMAANSYKNMYGDKKTFSNISIMSSRVFGARIETC